MKKTLLAAMLIAVTALFLSCSNGSGSDSGSGSKEFKAELFADDAVPETYSESSITLSEGTWIRSEIFDYGSGSYKFTYYYKYQVSATNITCEEYRKYKYYTLDEASITAAKKANKDDILNTYSCDDYYFDDNTLVTIKEYDDEETASESRDTTTFSTSYTILTNADHTKYKFVSSIWPEYFEKQ